MHKQLATAKGTVHYWIERGPEEAGCLFFTHGVTADHTMFEQQVAAFAGKATLITWDVPMHGLSRAVGAVSYKELAEMMQQILQAEGIDRVVLVGMSMGGYPSQYFGLLYPAMVAGFIALDTTPLGIGYYSRSDMWWLKRVAPMAKWFPAGLLRWSMAKSISKTAYSHKTMMAILKRSSKAEIIEQMRMAYEYLILENRDVTFDFPVLILLGDKDSTGKVQTYCKEWAANTGYPLRMIPNAKHFANGDNPTAVNAEIAQFLQQIQK